MRSMGLDPGIVCPTWPQRGDCQPPSTWARDGAAAFLRRSVRSHSVLRAVDSHPENGNETSVRARAFPFRGREDYFIRDIPSWRPRGLQNDRWTPRSTSAFAVLSEGYALGAPRAFKQSRVIVRGQFARLCGGHVSRTLTAAGRGLHTLGPAGGGGRYRLQSTATGTAGHPVSPRTCAHRKTTPPPGPGTALRPRARPRAEGFDLR